MDKKRLCGMVVLLFFGLFCHGGEYFTQSLFYGGFDLNGFSITFTPDGSADYYSADGKVISELPVDASTHTPVPLSDDTSIKISFTDSMIFVFYGVPYYGVNIGSNGYLTFTEHSGVWVNNLENHFAIPRISTFFNDLNPELGGRVVRKQLGDRFVVTFLDVPVRWDSTRVNTFQTELFHDGRIRMSWLGVINISSIVGLSRGGGVPTDFVQSDISSFAWDLDEDGIPDTWEQQYFGNPTNCVPTEDADGDGFNNKAEYICGTHPKDASSFFRITCSLADNNTGAIVIGCNTLNGRSYRVLRNDTLSHGSFETLDGVFLFPQNSYTATVQSAQSSYFYKVEVELAD